MNDSFYFSMQKQWKIRFDMGKNTLKNTDFLGKREKITSKTVKITDFYYLCTIIKQCQA